MNVQDAPFFKGFVRMADDGWCQGWHERNGGNLSYRLKECEVQDISDDLYEGEWVDISDGIIVPELKGDFFMITAAGSFFRNIADFPESCLGIIEIDDRGGAYRKRWGFARDACGQGALMRPSGRPTSELPSHLLIHQAKVSEGSDARVVYHCHPANVAAMTFVLPLDGDAMTQVLWSMISECAMVFPEGVGVLGWMVPGSVDLGRASAELMRRQNAVIWPHHGLVCTGEGFDLTFGLAHTIEKASEIFIKARSSNAGSIDFMNCITKSNIDELDAAYSLDINWPDKNN